MKGFFIRTTFFIVGVFLIISSFKAYFKINVYPTKLSTTNSMTKLKGLYLLDNAPEKDIMLLGASELNTLMIPSNPTNFFSDDNEFTVNMIGRGSCQAIVHASILAASKNISNKKVAIIISPQSFVPNGIASDMYFANFSPLQYLTIQLDKTLSKDIKQRFSKRYLELYDSYTLENGKNNEFYSYRMLVKMFEEKSMKNNILSVALKPYIFWKYNVLSTKDIYDTWLEYKKADNISINEQGKVQSTIDWENEKQQMQEVAKHESDNNEFGFLNDYYDSNIGMRLDDYEDKYSDLSYSESKEYEDLTLLLDICEEKGIKPLMIHTPLNGNWSDFTGFEQSERQEYYQKVLELLDNYNTKIADLTVNEYKPYYLCDVMHLGWIGWLDIDEKLGQFFYEN